MLRTREEGRTELRHTGRVRRRFEKVAEPSRYRRTSLRNLGAKRAHCSCAQQGSSAGDGSKLVAHFKQCAAFGQSPELANSD